MRGAIRADRERGAIAATMAALWAVGAWQANAFGIWSAVGGTAVLLGIAAVVLDRPGLRAALGFESRAVVFGAAAGLAMSAFTYLLFTPVITALPQLRVGVTQLYVAFGTLTPIAVLLALPVVVACEEIVWRGVVYSALVARMPPTAAVATGTALYVLAHAPIGSPALLLACVGAGVCWNSLRAATGSLSAVFVAHIIWDFLLLVLYPLAPSD